MAQEFDVLRRRACVLAHEAKDCGPAALATVARHYGLYVSLGRARELSGTDLQGSDLGSLRKAAESLGFSASCGRAKGGAIDKLPLPAILHLNDPPCGHFVVLHRISEKEAVIADPARGLVTSPRGDLLRSWSGYVVLLAPSARFQRSRGTEPALRELFRIALTQRRSLAVAVCLALGITLLTLAPSVCLQMTVDHIIPNSSIGMLYLLGGGIFGILIFRALAVLAREYLLGTAGQRLETSLGLRYLRHILSLPLAFFDRRQAGELLDRIYDVTFIRRAATNSVLTMLLDVTFLLLSTSFLAWYNLKLTLVAWCAMPAVATVTLISIEPLSRKQRETKERMSQLASRLLETVTNMRVVKVFTSELEAYQTLAALHAKVRRATFDTERCSYTLGVVSFFLAGMASAVLLVWGSYLAIEKRLTVGELVLFYSILGFFLSTVEHLGPSVTWIREAMVGIERLSEIESVEPERGGVSHNAALRKAKGTIEFRDVCFWYREGRAVLTDINLKIGTGETVAVLGQTGSGKTTLACLIAGLYLPRAGEILVDDQSIVDWDQCSLRRNLAIVFQDGGLLSDTIRENISMGCPAASTDEIVAAAKMAKAHDFIMTLPNGYDYTVGNQGIGLSSGQRQRVAIARALLRNPPIMIFDEATSNLDSETERHVMDSLMKKRRGQTTIIITHRLSTALRADRIVVLGSGKIIETGQHDELLDRQGSYYAMWNALPPLPHVAP